MKKKLLVGSFVIFACVALLGVPAGFAGDALKVGAYGGYFKDSFDKHIYPDFTKETGIKIESAAVMALIVILPRLGGQSIKM